MLDDDNVFGIDDTFSDEEYGICDVEFRVIFEHRRRLTSKAQVLVSQESKLARDRIVSGRSVASKASDDSCFELAKKWRDTCFTTDEGQCVPQTQVSLPTRVIDVGPSDRSRALWLKETNGELGSFITLSHCWGKVANFVTVRQNLEERKRIIRMDDIPKTFSDVVLICRLLGYRYL
ncbi:hypothetical protein BDZ45DRAFT_807872 [Acephala macrosclerotiorum]|nr:hypothetical protein BDZ45DRAFT_807872 [Acephala macrosclerotiorum]